MGIKVKIDLEADAQKLADTIQKGVSKGFKGGSASGLASDPSDLVRQMMGEPARKARAANLAPEWFLAQGAGQLSKMGSLFTNPSTKLMPEWFLGQAAGSAQQMGELFPYQGPVPPKIKDAKNGGLSGLMGILGISGPEGIAIAAASAALLASFKALKYVVSETVESFERARKLYAHAFLSGTGLGFSVSRQNLSDVLGVSEKDVFQFGAAVALLSPRLKFANDTMARMTPNLTSVSYEFEILKKDTEAMFMTLANDLAPEIKAIVTLLDYFVRGLSAVADALKKHMAEILEFIVGALPINDVVKSAIESFIKASEGLFHAAPSPQGLMKQLPASALERMGLVVGGFGSATSDYARRTATATEHTNKLLEKIATGAASGGAGSFFDPMASNP
jgi:hypothetical protein